MAPNIVLIGMPGAGKSTVGVILAKIAGRQFIDTDLLIQQATGRGLQEIADRDGHAELRRIEETVLLALDRRGHVIATGGSAVYSEAAMRHLKAGGVVVFLDAALPTLSARIDDFSTRGLAKRPDQDFPDLFRERLPLYRRHADLTINCDRSSQDQCAREILRQVEARH